MSRRAEKKPSDWLQTRKSLARRTVALAAALALFDARAQAQSALPRGGAVASGSASISSPSANSLTVTQTSQRAIVNWDSFSIGSQNSVTFTQPNASAAILNRVTGDTPTSIAGQINANGQVYLVNPNGIAITSSGAVNVGGGFVASTLGIADNAFNSGNLSFTGNGASAKVTNAGSIAAGSSGFVGLLGGAVANSGTISAPLGKIGLGSGEQQTLDLNGDGFLQVAIPTQTGANGQPLIDVSGKVKAAGGRVEIKAATAAQAVRDAVNISGTVSASSARRVGGLIVLDGGAGGQVTVSGKVKATSKKTRGGAVRIGGWSIGLRGALIDVSGSTGGGSATIGGGAHGAAVPGLTTAQTVSIDATSSIKADAKQSGDGGQVTIWSNALTDFRGSISAQAFGASGNGGGAEVSGGALNYQGTTNLLSAHGFAGTLRLDPYDVTISTAADSGYSNWTATASGSNINTATLQNALATANVTVATGASGAQTGNITVASPLVWTASTTLTLSAAGAIALNANIYGPYGGLTLSAGASGSAVTATGALNVGTLNLIQGAWAQNTASLPSFYAGNFAIGGNASFLRAAGGSGTSGSPYLLTDIYGVQGAATSTAYLAAAYQLANDIDASSTSSWNAGAGFAPIGLQSGTGFSGTFNGAGHAIANLYVNLPAVGNGVGMFGYTQAATIENLALLNANVTGGSSQSASGYGAGVLVGVADSGTLISGVVVTGTMTGSASASASGSNIGGIVGDLTGGSTLQNSAAAVDVTSAISSAGGAVGAIETGGAVQNVSATGAVKGAAGQFSFGGLAGYSNGAILDSYATGAVNASSASWVGGLVGNFNSSGSIVNSYAAGAVSGGSSVGGLVGYAAGNGMVSGSYWNTTTTGQDYGGVGPGATGETTANMQSQSTFSGWDFSGTWYFNASGAYAPTLRGATTILGTNSTGLNVSTSADSSFNVNTTSLQNFLGAGNVLVSTTSGPLTIANPVSWSSGANLSLASSGWLTVMSGANVTATGAGNLGLYAVSGPTAGAVMTLNAATISTSSGNLSIMAPSAGSNSAVNFNGATLDAGAGTGTVFGGSTTESGVYLAPSTNLTTSGAIGITATSQSGPGFYADTSAGIINNSGSLSITGASVSGIGVFLYSGAQSIANNGAGSLQISGLSLSPNDYGLAINSNLTTSGGVTISGTNADSSYGAYFNGSNITDSSGSLTISASSAGGNAVWVNGGTLALTNSGAGAFQLIGSSTLARGIRFNTGANLTVSGAVTLSGTSSQSDGLSFKGGNTITISSGSPTFTGVSTSYNGVYLQGATTIDNETATQVAFSGTSASGYGLKIESAANVTTAGPVLLAGASSSSYGLVNVGGNTIAALSGGLVMSGSSSSGTGVILQGTATLANGGGGLTVTGSSASTSGEGVNIQSGAVYTTSGGVAFTDMAGSLGATAVDVAGTLTASSGSLTVAPNSANNILVKSGATLSSTGSGAIALTTNGAGTITNAGTISGGASAGAITLTTTGTGAISDGAGTIAQAGPGAITLQATGSGAITADAVTYSNAAANILTISASGGAVDISNNIVSSGGALAIDVSGPNIWGSANIASGGGLATFATAGGWSLSGVISGTGGVTVSGTGLMELTGVNTYSGPTTVSSGSLEIGNAGSLGSGSYAGAISIASGATFEYNSSAAQTLSGAISGSGWFEKYNAASILTLSGANSFSGVTWIGGGTLALANSGALGGATAVTVASAATLSLSNVSATLGSGGNVTLTDGSTLSGTGTLTIPPFSGAALNIWGGVSINGGAGLTVNASSNNGYSAGVGLSSGSVLTTTGTVTLNATGTGAAGSNYAFSTNGAATLDASSGTLTVNVTPTAGDIGVNLAGPLTVGGAVTLNAASNYGGSVFNFTGSPGLTLLANANLALNVTGGSDPYAMNASGYNWVLGSGAVATLTGSKPLVWDGAWTVTGGTVNVQTPVSATGASTIADTGAMNVSGAISGSGAITLSGGAFNFSGANSYAGATTVSAGTLQAGSTTAFGSNSAVTVASGATLDLNGSSNAIGSLAGAGAVTDSSTTAATLTTGGANASTTFSGGVQNGAGTVSLTQNGTGTLTLSGANSYTGATTVAAGTLNLSGSWNVGSNTATTSVAAGATLSGAGTITATTLSDSGVGTVSLTGANAVGALASSGTVGPFAFNNAQSLSIGSVSSSGALTVTTTPGSGANLTLAGGAVLSSSSANTAITLAADNAFINNAGASALSTPSGRWLVFSSAPGGDAFNNLNSGNVAIWATTYASSGGAVGQSGNRYVFATQPVLTFASTSDSKTYGADDTTTIAGDYSVAGYQPGVAGAFLGDSAASAYSGAPSVTSAGSTATAVVSGSPYMIAISQGGLSAANGYAFAFASSGTLAVNPAGVIVTALGGSSTYGASPSNPGLSATGLQNGESVSALTGLSNSFGVTNATNAGTYALNLAGALTNPNYVVSSAVAGSWTVNPAGVIVTALGGSSTYGASPSNPGLSATGLQNGESVSALTGLSNSFGVTSATNAGTYALNVAGALTNPNYVVSSAVAGSWTVNPAGVIVTALGGSSTYGASPSNPGLSATGLQNGESVSALTGLSNSFGVTSATNAGTYALNVAGALTNPNYVVSSAVAGSWTVNPAGVIVTALGGSSTYGASPSNPGLSATGLQNGESVSALTGLSNSFGVTSATNAGTYALNVAGALTNPNYVVSSAVAGNWTVNPAGVIVTALGGSSTYGASPSNPGLSATGLQNGESVSVLTGLSNSFGVTSATNAGTYALNVAGALTNPNYVVSSAVAGSWTVNPAGVIVAALGGSSTYGASPSNPGLSATGLQNGESVSVLTGLGNSFGVSARTRVGDYIMNVVGGLTNGNYTVTSVRSSNWMVIPLRGPQSDELSPSNAGLAVKAPSINGGSAAVNGIDDPSSNINVSAAGSVGLLSSVSSSRSGAGSPSAAPPAGASREKNIGGGAGLPATAPASALIGVAPTAPHLADALTNLAATAAKPSCADESGGGIGGDANPSIPGASSDLQTRGCRSAAQASSRIDRALSTFDREAMVSAIAREFAEARRSAKAPRATLNIAIAGASLMLTAGFVGWLLRGGALLSALLSSMPLWRGFDPLTIMMPAKRPDEDADQPPSDVDRIFDGVRS